MCVGGVGRGVGAPSASDWQTDRDRAIEKERETERVQEEGGAAAAAGKVSGR